MQAYQFRHRSDIQGLRGVAVILVVLYHAHLFITGGYIGVDVFFVISGFVIAGGILREVDHESRTFSFARFYKRRIQRLLPSLALTTFLTLLLGVALSPYSSLKFLRRTGLAATFFNANHYLWRGADYFAPAAERNALLHTWSLSVEEQFYFVFPLLFILGIVWARRRGAHRYKVLAWLISALSSISLILALLISYLPGWFTWGVKLDTRAVFFMMPWRAWEFGAGVLIACALPWLVRSTPRPMLRAALFWAGLLSVCGGSLYFDGETLFPGAAALLPVMGTSAMILAGSLPSEKPLPIVSHRLLTRVGDLSYGWYLWHWPLLVFVQATWPGSPRIPMLLTLIVSLGLAWLNERYIEKPIRHAAWTKKKWATPVTLALCLALPIAGFLIHRQILKAMSQDREVLQIEKLEQEYAALGCNVHPYRVDQTTCRWLPEQQSSSSKPWRVVLVGDSNARQFIPALSKSVPELGGELYVATLNGCLFSDLTMLESHIEYASCRAWYTQTMRELEAHPPDLVLITSSYDNYMVDPFLSLRTPEDEGSLYDGRAAKTSALADSLSRVSLRLTRGGSDVAFIKTIPKFVVDDEVSPHESSHEVRAIGPDCSLLRLKRFPESCSVRRPLGTSQEFQHPWRDSMAGREVYERALEHPGVSEILVDEALCPSGVCAMRRDSDGVWIYRDVGHLSPEGARAARPAFDAFLERWKASRRR